AFTRSSSASFSASPPSRRKHTSEKWRGAKTSQPGSARTHDSNSPARRTWSRIAAWSPSRPDRKSTRLNSSHVASSYAVSCLKKKTGSDRYLVVSCAARGGTAFDAFGLGNGRHGGTDRRCSALYAVLPAYRALRGLQQSSVRA